MLQDAGIGENFTADMMRAYLSDNPEGDINIEIETIGGDVIQGFEIYDMLEAEKAKGRIVNTYGKQFDSIGSIIFLAGSEGHRYAYKGSNALIHCAWLSPEDLEGLQLNADLLREIADDNEEADYQMMHVYLSKAGRDRKREIQDLMRNETQLTDQQLLDFNFASEIISSNAAVKSQAIRALAFNSLRAEDVKNYSDCIIIREGKVFLIQRSLDDDFEAGTFAFPGGKIEEGENPEFAAIRELSEETGLTASSAELIEAIPNDNGSISHYFFITVPEIELELDSDEVAGAGWYDINQLPENIIKGQSDRYTSLIQKSVEMSEKTTAFDKAIQKLESLAARFSGAAPKAMLVPLKDGGTELFVYSEDGEFEGKRAVIAENGEPTDQNAPAGSHELNDGRSITVGEGGIIESVQESQAAMYEEEMTAMKEEVQAMKEENQKALQALKAAKDELAAVKADSAKALNAMRTEVEELKNIVPGDDAEKEQIEKLQAMKKANEEFKKMKPSERRLAALKIESNK